MQSKGSEITCFWVQWSSVRPSISSSFGRQVGEKVRMDRPWLRFAWPTAQEVRSIRSLFGVCRGKTVKGRRFPLPSPSRSHTWINHVKVGVGVKHDAVLHVWCGWVALRTWRAVWDSDTLPAKRRAFIIWRRISFCRRILCEA